jgi:Protein of unknown function (DUF3533)
MMAQVGTMTRSASAGEAETVHGPARLLRPIVGGLALLVALLGLIGTAIRDPRPHDIPVGIAGPPAAVRQVSTALGAAAPGAFRLTSYDSEAAARAALDSRSVDGVLVLGGAAPRVIVAGAGGDGPTGVITAAFTGAFKAQGATVTVETVHPFAAGDPHGLILFFVVVAVLISTLVAQAALGLGREVGSGTRLLVATAFAVLAGAAGMGTAAWIAGGYGSGFWAAAALVALASSAVGVVMAGSVRLLGAAGIALAALVVVLVDLVSSGGPVGSQLLPDFYRWLAPWMPANELYGAMRGVLYFDGAGVGRPVIVLGGWLLGGLVLLLMGELLARRRHSASPAVLPAQ